MPKIVEKTKTDPFMKKYWDLNEAGHYKKAHDLMVTYKIDKYGADVVKAWGMEYTNPWAPVVHLQNRGYYKQGKLIWIDCYQHLSMQKFSLGENEANARISSKTRKKSRNAKFC